MTNPHAGATDTEAARVEPPHGSMLAGYTVLDLTQFLSGPLCTSTLAAFGADVIKVESPAGDGNRQLPPFVSGGDDGGAGGGGGGAAGAAQHDRSLVHLKRNQGKKSIVLDLKTDEGRRVLGTLMGASDVVVHNFRAGVDERVGADYETARAANPNIIHCAITGQFGSIGDVEGAEPQPPGGVIDLVGQALSGLLGASGAQGGEPTRSRAPIADQSAGLYAALAILAALLERDVRRGGEGSRSIRVPMVETLGSLLWDESLDSFQAQGMENRMGNLSGRLCPYNTYRTADDRFVAIAAASTGEWKRLVGALDLPELRAPEWEHAANRSADRPTIDALIGSWTRTRERDELITLLRSHGVTVGAVLEVDDMLRDGEYKDGVLYTIPDAEHGELHAPRFPVEVDGQRIPAATGAVPGLGEHGREVLRGMAGLDDAEIEELVGRGIVGGGAG